MVEIRENFSGSHRQSGAAAALAVHLKALRPHHWAKNLLVFLPAALAHQLTNPYVMWWSFLAFAAFSLTASATYLINDLVDMESDRKHPTKCKRPLASGAMRPIDALVMIPILVGSAIGLAFLMPRPDLFLLALGCYIVLGQTYVFYLKRKLLVDVLALATLHVLRILAGNAATGIDLSSWLLIFAMFLFFSLAILKRYSELRDRGDDVGLKGVGRGYVSGDLETLSQLGMASALISVVIVALYVNSKQVTELYARPELIWLICPIVLYVLSRIWVLARRGQVADDPLMFIIQDWRSQLMAVIVIGIIMAAKWVHF